MSQGTENVGAKRARGSVSTVTRVAIAIAMFATASIAFQLVSIGSADAFCLGEDVPAHLSAQNGKEKPAWNSTCDDDSQYYGKSLDNAPGNGHCAIAEHQIGRFGTWSQFWNCYDQVWVLYWYFHNNGHNDFKLCESGVGCSSEKSHQGY